MSGHALALASLVTLGAAAPCANIRPPSAPDLRRAPQVGDVQKAAELKKKHEQCEELGKKQIAFDEEQTIGQTVALNLIGERGLVNDREPVRYLNIVGRNLAERSERPGLPWLFGIIDDDATANAFSTPGGYVFVTTGLLKKVENEAQLAGVLAHEIIHITELHVANEYRAFKASTCKSSIASQAGASLVKGLTSSALSSAFNSPVGYINYGDSGNVGFLDDVTAKTANWAKTKGASDKEEQRSDEEGLALIISAGYQPQEYVRLIRGLGNAASKTYASADARAKAMESSLSGFAREDSRKIWYGLAPFGKAEGFVAPPLPPALASLRSR